MKKIIVILTISTLFSCNEKKGEDIHTGITEENVYLLINNHLIPLLKKRNDGVIYWNNKQIKSPAFEYTEIDDMHNIPPPPPPIISSIDKIWEVEKISGIEPVNWEEYVSYFNENDTVDTEEKWDLRFNNGFVYNVAYPIYNEKTKIAVIKVFANRPFLICGTGLQTIYFFKRTQNDWEVMDYMIL